MAGLDKHLDAMGDNVLPGQSVLETLTTSRWNGMMNAIRALARGENIGAGYGMLRRQTGNHTLFNAMGIGSKKGAVAKCPFDMLVAPSTGGNYHVTFRPGTISGFLPTNYLTPATVAATGTYYFWLECTASNGQITAATFAGGADQPGACVPQAGQPPTSFKVLLGIVVDHVATKLVGCGHLKARPEELFRTQKATTPAAGELPYEIYYVWDVRTV